MFVLVSYCGFIFALLFLVASLPTTTSISKHDNNLDPSPKTSESKKKAGSTFGTSWQALLIGICGIILILTIVLTLLIIKKCRPKREPPAHEFATTAYDNALYDSVLRDANPHQPNQERRWTENRRLSSILSSLPVDDKKMSPDRLPYKANDSDDMLDIAPELFGAVGSPPEYTDIFDDEDSEKDKQTITDEAEAGPLPQKIDFEVEYDHNQNCHKNGVEEATEHDDRLKTSPL